MSEYRPKRMLTIGSNPRIELWDRRVGFLYVFECEGFYKVGIAASPKERLTMLQIGCPFPIKWVAYRRTVNVRPVLFEKLVHGALREKHVRGEWFRATLEEIEDACFAAMDRLNERHSVAEAKIAARAAKRANPKWPGATDQEKVANYVARLKAQIAASKAGTESAHGDGTEFGSSEIGIPISERYQ